MTNRILETEWLCLVSDLRLANRVITATFPFPFTTFLSSVAHAAFSSSMYPLEGTSTLPGWIRSSLCRGACRPSAYYSSQILNSTYHIVHDLGFSVMTRSSSSRTTVFDLTSLPLPPSLPTTMSFVRRSASWDGNTREERWNDPTSWGGL